ncbi:hypothetical protein Vafri_7312 [Volvox africanus]|uniref:Uncharacterized protein n=1 Tax=Volvox africanus TaxID=51714 RepID=A0A8J4B4R7_9CHLO|nr:hypothetical protein Vafri_7312 [Volvox africanus]
MKTPGSSLPHDLRLSLFITRLLGSSATARRNGAVGAQPHILLSRRAALRSPLSSPSPRFIDQPTYGDAAVIAFFEPLRLSLADALEAVVQGLALFIIDSGNLSLCWRTGCSGVILPPGAGLAANNNGSGSADMGGCWAATCSTEELSPLRSPSPSGHVAVLHVCPALGIHSR